MKKIIISLILQYLFLMVFFIILRGLFLLYHIPMMQQENIGAGEALLSFWHAAGLDTATAAYILIIPSILLFLQGLFAWNWLNKVNVIYYFVVIFGWSLLTVAEIGVFSEWKFKLTTAAFIHLRHPEEVYYSIPAWKFFSLAGMLVLLVSGSFLLFIKVFHTRILSRVRWLYAVVYLVIVLPLLFVTLRGGFNAIPISQSAAHYSHHSFLNWAAVNSGYHLAVNIMETERYKNHNAYNFYDIEEARKVVDDIQRVEKDTTVSILTVQRPNIVMILLESWTADLIVSITGEPGITPEFALLEKEGLLFTDFYCTGNRSHEAVATLLGGHPALPYTTFTENPQKFNKMPSMIRILNDAGYNTSFYYGGQLDYGNLRAYLLFHQFNTIMEERDIDANIPRGRLGVHDQYVYDISLEKINAQNQPFFSIIFTSSSHSPYDFPMEPVIDWAGNENPFINSAYYADSCLGDFFRKARTQPWYENTLFVLVADHGHNSYRNWRYESYEYHRIPLMFFGDVIRDEFRGTRSGRISDNSFVTKTLLKQLGLPAGDFRWGADLFNPYSPEYAYMVLNDGYNWKSPGGEVVYSMKWKHFYKKEFPEGTTREQEEIFIRKGKSYVQVLFQEFLDM